MKTRPAYVVAVCLSFLFLASPASSIDKARYDIREAPARRDDGVTSASATGSLGWKITRTVGEVAVSSGGFFTIGTTGGTAGGTTTKGRLDDHCGITFGHPFARTSYPVICIDGVWMKPLAFFSADSERVMGAGDSLSLTYTLAGRARLTLTYALALDGGNCVIRSELRNLDLTPHAMGLGFAFDPGLGVRGDGFLSVDPKRIENDTVITPSVGDFITIRERSTNPCGLSISVLYPDGPPDAIIVANWKDRAELDGPTHPVPAVRRLYDLDLFSSWQPVSVPPDSVLTRSIRIQQNVGEFGQGVFLRWDVPDHSDLSDGNAFPVSFQSTITATNCAASAKTGTLSVSAGSQITFGTPSASLDIAGSSTSYGHAVASVEELYQETVVRLVAAYRDNGGGADSVVHYYCIPATAVTDTGLAVTIDSLATGAFPDVHAFFTVKREATGQYVSGLAPKNVFVTDNGVRITPSSVRRDTIGGGAQTDIVFVLDVTGSMGNAITEVKNSIIAFTDSLTSRGMAYRLAMVTFLDANENVYDFTTSATTFKSWVTAQYAHGGGDGPENSLDALDAACTMGWDPNARHVVAWITDNSYHEADWATVRTRQQVIAHLLETSIVVYSIGEPVYQTDWYMPIVNATGGKFYNYLGKFLDILVDIGLSNTSSRMVASYTAPVSGSLAHNVTVSVHYAGRGGAAFTSYTAPGSLAEHIGLVCYPNPFNPQTTLRLEGPGRSSVSVVLCDYLGREVRRIQIPPGDGVREIVWDARDGRGHDVATGVYFVRAVFVSSAGEVIGNAVTKILHLK
jgi:Mg-chelatase subunit ChlD